MRQNKCILFSGGKKYNINISKRSDVEKQIVMSKGLLELSSRYYEFKRILVKENEVIEPFTGIARTDIFSETFEFVLPCRVRINRIDYRKKTVEFTVLEDPVSPSADLLISEKMRRSGIWMEIFDPVRGSCADPFITPFEIFISLSNNEPPYSGNEENCLEHAYQYISEIIDVTPEFRGVKINFLFPESWRKIPETQGNFTFHCIEDKYPAFFPGVLFTQKKYLYGFSDNSVRYWHFDFITLEKIHQLVVKNEFNYLTPVDVFNCNDYGKLNIRPWTLISDLVENDLDNRVIRGGLLTGLEGINSNSVRPHDRSLTFISNPKTREMLQFLRPGFDRDSYSPLVASWYFPSRKSEVNAGLRGEKRMCIECGYCETICPARLEPSILWKLTKDRDERFYQEAIELGLRRCMECNLCSYVCPSKIELGHTITAAKHNYFIEQEHCRKEK
ncbi:MAG: 4Fe-4S dicluster domain-containing protein [Deltaproteobacteria bacterium]|nr:4Fe-4S dicluster domain-containing protein [Deltaproteobacteria bacterium]